MYMKNKITILVIITILVLIISFILLFGSSSYSKEFFFKCYNKNNSTEAKYFVNESKNSVSLLHYYNIETKKTTSIDYPLKIINWNLKNKKGNIWAVIEGSYGVNGDTPRYVSLIYFDFNFLKTITTSINPSLNFGPNQNTSECKFEDIK